MPATAPIPGVTLRRSWTRIAEEPGLTREAVYRALARLERQGRITRESGVVFLVAASVPVRHQVICERA